MSRMVQGNLAVKEAYVADEVRTSVKKRTVVRKAVIPAKEKLLYLFAIIFCAVVAGSVIFKYAQIYEMNTKIHELESELQVLHKENQMLKMEVRKLQEPKRLLEEARQLGFSPSEEDVVSVVSPVRLKSSQSTAIASHQ